MTMIKTAQGKDSKEKVVYYSNKITTLTDYKLTFIFICYQNVNAANKYWAQF